MVVMTEERRSHVNADCLFVPTVFQTYSSGCFYFINFCFSTASRSLTGNICG